MTAPDGAVDLAIGVRTVDGRPVGQIPCDETTSAVWSRERSEVSRAEIITADVDAGDLVPWLHWIDIWEAGQPVWSGPILEPSTELQTGVTRIEARDPSALLWYTRVPTTRRWSQLDPAPIAADLWQEMHELHRINVEPQVLASVGERFDFAVTADSRMLHQVLDELVRIGLDWTVVAGRPILGTPPTTAVIAELAECDFMVGLRRVRSGKRTASDVRVQGRNWAHTERVDMAGLRLQALVSLDDLFGVNNITAAARQYLAEVGAIRDVLEVPSGASLHPDAPVTVDDLIPGRVLTVHAADLATQMRIKTVEVNWSGTSRDVRVTLDSLAEPIELPNTGAML